MDAVLVNYVSTQNE